MPNHLHLLIQTMEVPLSRIMKTVQTSYACYFNSRYTRVGHVFQDRYKTIPCDIDSHLLELVRYIHLNPVRAGIVRLPVSYPWSSHREYVGDTTGCIADTDYIISMFDKTELNAKKRFNEFVLERLNEGRREVLHEISNQMPLGDDSVFKEEQLKHSDNGRCFGANTSQVELKKILSSVARYFAIDESHILSPIRLKEVTFARHVFILIQDFKRCHQSNPKTYSLSCTFSAIFM